MRGGNHGPAATTRQGRKAAFACQIQQQVAVVRHDGPVEGLREDLGRVRKQRRVRAVTHWCMYGDLRTRTRSHDVTFAPRRYPRGGARYEHASLCMATSCMQVHYQDPPSDLHDLAVTATTTTGDQRGARRILRTGTASPPASSTVQGGAAALLRSQGGNGVHPQPPYCA